MDSDRIFVKGSKVYDAPGKDRVEYLRAEPLREGLTSRIFQIAMQHAQRTPGISATVVRRARELVTGGG